MGTKSDFFFAQKMLDKRLKALVASIKTAQAENIILLMAVISFILPAERLLTSSV